MTQSILEQEQNVAFNYNLNNANNTIEMLMKYISESECPQMSVDISKLNIIDASRVIILSSTYHYAKYPTGEITWAVNSPEVGNLVKSLTLGNIKLITI